MGVYVLYVLLYVFPPELFQSRLNYVPRGD